MMSMHVARATLIAAGIALLTTAAHSQEEPPAPLEAKYDEEQMIWSLGEQTWEFGELATAYLPAKGTFNPTTGEAVWTLQLAKEMTPGEAGLQNTIEGSPFKPTFLDEDKALLVSDSDVKITTISGKMGDAIRVTILLPHEATLANVALIRLERRTEIGF